MPVDVDVVRAVEVPTRLVHDPGSLARLGETLRELGVARPMLVPDPGVAATGLAPLDAALAGVEELYRLTDDVGIPTMEELGFSEDEIPMLARIAFEDPQTMGNARGVEIPSYAEIYRNAFSRGKR